MSGSLAFVLVLPNARRETVKVTPDTSILQVLEDACKKRGLVANEWNLKHYNQVIELGNSVRFSGLPNNATLELVQSVKPRLETPVTVVLLLGSGQRLTHQFSSQTTLWQILEHWSTVEDGIFPGDPAMEAACVYMRQEINGRSKLEEKTLRSLGLFQGSAVIRLIHRPTNHISHQANVSTMLLARRTSSKHTIRPPLSSTRPTNTAPIIANNLTRIMNYGAEDFSGITKALDTSSGAATSHNSSTRRSNPTPPTTRKAPGSSSISNSNEGASKSLDMASPPQGSTPIENMTSSKMNKAKTVVNTVNVSKSQAGVNNTRGNVMSGGAVPPSAQNPTTTPPKIRTSSSKRQPATSRSGSRAGRSKGRHSKLGDLKILGPNDAVMYHADDVDLPEIESPPDEFYSVTVQDVRAMYHSLQEKRTQLEDAPLQTRSARNLEHGTTVQKILVSHSQTVVRVRFPDRFVLQGAFKTDESINVIYNFVRTYLADSKLSFYLFKTPPRKVLSQTATLIAEDLVGLAVIYFGSDSQRIHYLKESLPTSDPQRVFTFTPNSKSQANLRNAANGAIKTTTTPRVGVHDDGANPGSSNSEGKKAENRRTKRRNSNTGSNNQGPGVHAGGTNPNSNNKNAGHPNKSDVVPKWYKK